MILKKLVPQLVVGNIPKKPDSRSCRSSFQCANPSRLFRSTECEGQFCRWGAKVKSSLFSPPSVWIQITLWRALKFPVHLFCCLPSGMAFGLSYIWQAKRQWWLSRRSSRNESKMRIIFRTDQMQHYRMMGFKLACIRFFGKDALRNSVTSQIRFEGLAND